MNINYDVFAVQYGARRGLKSREYAGFRLYGEPDTEIGVGYFFWVARNEDRTVLIDCGYNLERARDAGRYTANEFSTSPLDALGRLGITPEDVDDVVLSHLHLDHAGNIESFPRARLWLSIAEYDWWTGPFASRELMTHLAEGVTMDILRAADTDGRVHLFDDEADVAPGIRAVLVGGHTAGQAIVEVNGSNGPVVLASDAVHFYEEFRSDRPFWIFDDLAGSYRTYELLRDYEERGHTVVPGHDSTVMDLFTPVDDNVVDLSRPIG